MSHKVLAVASGKGGTGKTTIALALAQALAGRGDPVTLLDADVEAPNTHLFLTHQFSHRHQVTRLVPSLNEEKCTGCGICRKVCVFRAILMLGPKPSFFPEMCSGCGACTRLCPELALSEVTHDMGLVQTGSAGAIQFGTGELNVGESRAVPVIASVRKHEATGSITIIDAPPGTSCPVIAAVRHSDHLLLVTEPTRFGLHDLQLAVSMGRELGLAMSVLVNRDGIGTTDIAAWCQEQQIPVALKIPFERRIGEGYAAGRTLLDVRPDLAQPLLEWVDGVLAKVAP